MLKHEHSGRLRPHKHTSYAGLFFVLLLAGVLLVGLSMAADAAVPAVNPQSGSIGLTGTVRGPAPTTSATMLTPPSGSHTTSIPITISGVCPVGTYVTITKNGVFGGSTACADDGTFTILVDLFDGSNLLIAQVTDALGQFGPNSAGVVLFYDAPSLTLPGGAIGKQLFLETNTTVVAGDPGQSIPRDVTIVGGVGPYAVEWDWGDGQTSLSSQANPGAVNSSHAYDRAGTYRVIARVTDSAGNSAYLEFVTVINGPATALGSTHGNGLAALPGELVAAWPLYILAGFMVAFFWLGERREIHKLRQKHLIA